mgnify:CR=1 FL=1
MRCPFPLVRVGVSGTGIPCVDCVEDQLVAISEDGDEVRTLFELGVCCVTEFRLGSGSEGIIGVGEKRACVPC